MDLNAVLRPLQERLHALSASPLTAPRGDLVAAVAALHLVLLLLTAKGRALFLTVSEKAFYIMLLSFLLILILLLPVGALGPRQRAACTGSATARQGRA